MWFQELRYAGMAAYKAAQTRSQDAILEALVVSDSCLHCHTSTARCRRDANRC